MNGGKLLNWLVTILLGLLSVMGGGLWYGQQNVTREIAATASALRELTVEFRGYKEWNDRRQEDFDSRQEEIIQRLNRAGLKP